MRTLAMVVAVGLAAVLTPTPELSEQAACPEIVLGVKASSPPQVDRPTVHFCEVMPRPVAEA